MPPISFPSRPASTRRTEEVAAPAAAEAASSAASTPAAAAVPPQGDWTQTLTDPDQQRQARTRHAGSGALLQAELLAQNERAEMDAIGGKNGVGQLMQQGGDPQLGTLITIHGINDNPASVAPLGERASSTGEALATFAWDDRSRRLGDSADDFAKAIKKTIAEHPDAPITINAFSMGGRVAAVGLARLDKEGALAGKDVRLNLVATPLGGFASANWAGMGAPFASSLKSSQDMGTRSAFQRELESVRFSDNVKVKVFGGGADEIAVMDNRWQHIAKNLAGGAEPTTLPGATHDSAVISAAALLR
jgi:pimeloyl-ACP methyl ester carboxylesterase